MGKITQRLQDEIDRNNETFTNTTVYRYIENALTKIYKNWALSAGEKYFEIHCLASYSLSSLMIDISAFFRSSRIEYCNMSRKGDKVIFNSSGLKFTVRKIVVDGMDDGFIIHDKAKDKDFHKQFPKFDVGLKTILDFEEGKISDAKIIDLSHWKCGKIPIELFDMFPSLEKVILQNTPEKWSSFSLDLPEKGIKIYMRHEGVKHGEPISVDDKFSHYEIIREEWK